MQLRVEFRGRNCITMLRLRPLNLFDGARHAIAVRIVPGYKFKALVEFHDRKLFKIYLFIDSTIIVIHGFSPFLQRTVSHRRFIAGAAIPCPLRPAVYQLQETAG